MNFFQLIFLLKTLHIFPDNVFKIKVVYSLKARLNTGSIIAMHSILEILSIIFTVQLPVKKYTIYLQKLLTGHELVKIVSFPFVFFLRMINVFCCKFFKRYIFLTGYFNGFFE